MNLCLVVFSLVVLAVCPTESRGRLRGRGLGGGKVFSRNTLKNSGQDSGELFNIHRGHHSRTHHNHQHPDTELDFLSTRTRPDEEVEVRLSYRGVRVLETQLPGIGERGLYLREVSDGHRVVKAVFQWKGGLVDCDILKNLEDVEKFLLKFFEPEYLTDYLQHAGQGDKYVQSLSVPAKANTTFQLVQKGQLDADQQEMVNFKEIKLACRELHHEVRRMLKQERRRKKDNARNVTDDSILHRRSKRSMFIYPGTNWCGTGNAAQNYNDLGESFDTDKCCRQHDHCPHMIEGFTTAYNLFNYRFHTLSHCNCDESFRHCLKTTSSPTANMVGRLYFNMMGLRCFTLSPHNVCMKRSWWGTCVQWEKQYLAQVQEAQDF